MAQQPDLPGATTSYSDPFYDRLEALAQRITKRLWLLAIALVVVVVVAVVTHAAMRDTPIAASAGQFLDAATKRMEAERAREPSERTAKLAEAEKAFAAVAANETVTPYYRARACIEITQLELDRSAINEAKASIAKARVFATTALDPDLDLAIGLSEAAVLFQAGEFAAAETRYLNVESGASGLTHPDRQIAATIGAAQAMVALNRIDDAIAKLEGLANRTDNNATMLLSVAKNEYWALKRRKASPPAALIAPAPPAIPAPAAPVVIPAPVAPVPSETTAPVPAPAVLTPAPVPTPAPAATTPAPVAPAPAAPVPAATPEGK